MKKNKLMVVLGAVVCMGIVSQVVERNIDEEAVKSYVTANFQENDEPGGHIDFEIGDREEETILEKIGF